MTQAKGTVEISLSNARKIVEALPILLHQDARVFDIETTGIEKSRNEIVSFAAKSSANQESMQTLIMPKRPQNLLKKDSGGKCAYDINGIHPDDLVGSPKFEEAYPLIRQMMENKYWICWNADFDVGFLDAICDRRRVERIPRLGVWCAMEILSPLAGLRGQRRGEIETVAIRDGVDDRFRKQKLSNLAKRMGIDTRNAHDAIADVEMTIQILQWASDNLKSLPAPSNKRVSLRVKTEPAHTEEMAEITLIYSRQGKNGQYWVLQPDHDAYGEAFLFENQFGQKRFSECGSFFSWLKTMPIGCISLPPAQVLLETKVNSQGYTRVASLRCEEDIPKANWRVNVRRKRRLFSRGWQVRSEWKRDLSDALSLALELDGYAYCKE